MNMRYWENKNILITGFEGFLGSNLTRKLICSGAKVIGLDIKINRKQTILSASDYRKVETIKGSVTNYELLKEIILGNKINIVFHLAAEALVGKGFISPRRAFKANICGTWNILEACRFADYLEGIVITSSDKAYGAHDILPYKENYPLAGTYPYDVSKSCADLIAGAYFHTYGLRVAVTRCGNIYGPGDFNFSRLIPDVMRCLFFGRKLLIRSNGMFVRDYVYVDDIVDGYIKLAEALKKGNLAGEAFNFSDEKPIPVVKLVKIIYKLAGAKPDYKILNQAKYEIVRQYLSAKKARNILGWYPRHTLTDGLIETIKWYNNYFSGK